MEKQMKVFESFFYLLYNVPSTICLAVILYRRNCIYQNYNYFSNYFILVKWSIKYDISLECYENSNKKSFNSQTDYIYL